MWGSPLAHLKKVHRNLAGFGHPQKYRPRLGPSFDTRVLLQSVGGLHRHFGGSSVREEEEEEEEEEEDEEEEDEEEEDEDEEEDNDEGEPRRPSIEEGLGGNSLSRNKPVVILFPRMGIAGIGKCISSTERHHFKCSPPSSCEVGARGRGTLWRRRGTSGDPSGPAEVRSMMAPLDSRFLFVTGRFAAAHAASSLRCNARSSVVIVRTSKSIVKFLTEVYSYCIKLLLIFFAENMENTVQLSTTPEKSKIHGFWVNTKYSMSTTFSASSTAIALTDAEDGVDDATPTSTPTSTSTSSSVAMTVDEVIELIGIGPFQYLLIAVAGMALIGDASEMMLLSFLGPIVQCFFGVDDPEQEAILTTIVFIGMSIGGLSFGALADRVGRRVGLLSTALFCSIGGVASALSATFGVLLFFRFCVGVGLGGVAVAYSYALEFIPAKNRGKAGVLLQSFWTVGTLIQAILTWVSFNALGWRWVVALSAIPIFILLLLFSRLPESPRYLALKGDHVKCKDTLCKMATRNGTMSRVPHKSDLTIKTRSVHAERTILQNYQEAFSKGFRRDTILLLIIWFANAFVYYGLVLLTTELALVRERAGVAGVAGDSGDAASASNRSSTPASHHGLDCAHLLHKTMVENI